MNTLVLFALNSEHDDKTELAFLTALFGPTIEQCQGKYKGVKETSYLIHLVDIDNERELFFNTLKQYNQESILFVSECKSATLLYIETNKVETIGEFKRVENYRALTLDSYTIINGSCFICE